jgi:hypothetical protein
MKIQIQQFFEREGEGVMSIQPIEIARILIKETIQQRVQLNENVISEYFEGIQAGAQFPPLVVFDDGQNLILADGRHRYEAYKLAGTNDIPVEIRNGTERDAILYAVGANADHGLQRTNADKRCAVETMLKDEEWGIWSDGEIARRTRVSPPFVSKIRRELTQNGFEFPSKRISRNGRTIETSNIGSRNTGSDSGQGDSDQESPVDDNHGDEGPPEDNENSSGDQGENDSASETEGNGPDEEAQNNFEEREDNDRDVTSAETQGGGNEEISNEKEGRDASLTETQGESDEGSGSDESEGRAPESLGEMIGADQGESSVSDAENPSQEQSSEPELSSPVQTDDIKSLRHRITELEQLVREQDRQLYFKDQRIAELEEKLAYYEHEILAS